MAHSLQVSETRLPPGNDYEQQEMSKFRKRVISRQHQKQSFYNVSSGEVDVSKTPVLSTQKTQRQYINDRPKILQSDYTE